ncbi:hypothetical protein DMH04_19950 [Kibdelosporangium aridum]|uniref:Uncharacterized protein n=1 Tax=Kibdelosporangium aridum TaxID=2030 RepID=A0A428Z9L9_KIBAR|nr:hypothetical protein [Kibdelosporangium aridum]RSM84754.1 hypothetical protein DMH04_19950 [Kibdelosporangium aridum]
MNRKTPPAYVVHRSLIFALVAVVALMIGFIIADMVPGLSAAVMNAVEGMRQTWQGFDWELF